MWVLDGWMAYDFTSFSTVFRSCQSDVRVIMKDYVQWNLINGWKDFLLKRASNPGPLD